MLVFFVLIPSNPRLAQFDDTGFLEREPELVEASGRNSSSAPPAAEIKLTDDSSCLGDDISLPEVDLLPAKASTGNEPDNILKATTIKHRISEDATRESDNEDIVLSVSDPYEQISSALEKLLQDYHENHLPNTPTNPTFVMYRAVGNDLPPRHAVNPTYNNVKFILENEPELPDLDVRWYVNRIVDPEEELRIVRLLMKHRQVFTINRIDYDKYAQVDYVVKLFNGSDIYHSSSFRHGTRSTVTTVWDNMLHDKNIFVINNNGARNAMLDLGLKSGAEYVLPWDGNCFLTQRAWNEVKKGISDVGKVVAGGILISLSSISLSAKERFNENQPYGNRPKVDLLWSQKVSGPWDNWLRWEDTPFILSIDVAGRGSVRSVGWTARLSSGVVKLDQKGAAVARGVSRSAGVENLAANSSKVLTSKYGYSEQTLMLYNEKQPEKNRQSYQNGGDVALTKLVQKLTKLADEELARDTIYTVTDKPKAAPAEDVHDYLSAAPYYWPNTSTADGFPYVPQDGQRVPGSVLYDGESNKYDRTRVANFVRTTTILTLAEYFTGDTKYSHKAAELVRAWFVDEKTRMKPNLKYCQMRFKSALSTGSSVLDFISVSVVLDSVRLLRKRGALTWEDMVALNNWVQQYANFLRSEQCQDEYYSPNNHGTLFDVQAASIYAFRGDFKYLIQHTSLARGRVLSQFDEDGSMPEEMKRQTQLHYMYYGLHPWTLLAQMSERIGVDMWSFRGTLHEPILMRGAKFAVPYFAMPDWSHRQENETDMDLCLYSYYIFRDKYPDLTVFASRNQAVPPIPKSVFEVKPAFSDYFLIPPFWNLALSASN